MKFFKNVVKTTIVTLNVHDRKRCPSDNLFFYGTINLDTKEKYISCRLALLLIFALRRYMKLHEYRIRRISKRIINMFALSPRGMERSPGKQIPRAPSFWETTDWRRSLVFFVFIVFYCLTTDIFFVKLISISWFKIWWLLLDKLHLDHLNAWIYERC